LQHNNHENSARPKIDGKPESKPISSPLAIYMKNRLVETIPFYTAVKHLFSGNKTEEI
jgi:hypothetical protein